MSTVDGTIQATVDGLKKIVEDAEARSATLREEVASLRQQIIDVEGPEAEKARQNLRRLGVPAFSDWQRPLPKTAPAPGGPKEAPKAAAATPAPSKVPAASQAAPRGGKK